MRGEPVTLISGPDGANAAELHSLFEEARKLFLEEGQQFPSLPTDIAKYVGCKFLMTSVRHANGERSWRISMTDRRGNEKYEQNWPIQTPQ